MQNYHILNQMSNNKTAVHIRPWQVSAQAHIPHILRRWRELQIFYTKNCSHCQKCKIWIFERLSPSNSPEIALHTFRHSPDSRRSSLLIHWTVGSSRSKANTNHKLDCPSLPLTQIWPLAFNTGTVKHTVLPKWVPWVWVRSRFLAYRDTPRTRATVCQVLTGLSW